MSNPVVQVYCSRPSPYHDKYGTTFLVTLGRADFDGAHWMEARGVASGDLAFMEGDDPVAPGRGSSKWRHPSRAGLVSPEWRHPSSRQLRAKVERKCKCGLSLRLRLERIEPILEGLWNAGEWQISATALKRLADGRV